MLVPNLLEKTTIRDKRTLMIYVSAFFFMLAYTILAYSIASFLMNRFPDNPNAIVFVGFILGMASFFAIFVDAIWAYLQKIFSPRTLTICALIGLIITVSIFFLSSFGDFSVLRWTSFTFMAAFLYGWSFDLYDVTVVNTIVGRSDKEALAQNISQKKVAEALGMVVGLVTAGILVNFGESFTQFVLIIALIMVTIFFAHHFDKEEYDKEKLEFSEHVLFDWKTVFAHIGDTDKVKNISHEMPEKTKQGVLELSEKTALALKNLPSDTLELSKKVLEASRKELIEILAKEGEIVIKKPEKSKSNFSFTTMIREVKDNFVEFFSIFVPRNFKFILLWIVACAMLFSFWDTMVVTYQPLFLKEFAQDNPVVRSISGLLMVIFIFPVFALQIPFSKLADKIGREKMVLAGLTISAISVITLSTTSNIFILILAGMGGGAGYAAAFSPAQAMFISEFKKFSQESRQKNNINQEKKDEEESGSGSLRLTLNLGNIFGQMMGGAIFATFGFRGGFLFFGVIFAILAIVSVVFYKKIKPQPVSATSNKEEVKQNQSAPAPAVEPVKTPA